MNHTYKLTGMTCSDCEAKVKSELLKLEHISEVEVSKEENSAIITMDEHLSLDTLQEAIGGNSSKYQISIEGEEKTKVEKKSCCSSNIENPEIKANPINQAKYYCPMHCEGEKVYDKAGDCPVCGMDLVQQPILHQSHQYTCPMHPEIITDQPGSCPICGMDLVPLKPSESQDQKTYKDLVRRMKIALVFTIPVFLIAMIGMIHNNPLEKIMSVENWNWVQFVLTLPVVFYACWLFFIRAWKSIITWNLNMFTLIGIGTGVAFLFSIFGLFFPNVFPAEFKTAEGTVHLYFEATVVILTLVLLGQLMEAKAHSQTSGAIPY